MKHPEKTGKHTVHSAIIGTPGKEVFLFFKKVTK